MLTREEEKKRITLYKRGLSDRQIAEKLGVEARTISAWRKRRELPARGRNQVVGGVPMGEALSPEQCEIMRKFLGDLNGYAKELSEGVKPDVSGFMREWRRTYSYCSEPGRTVKKRRSLS